MLRKVTFAPSMKEQLQKIAIDSKVTLAYKKINTSEKEMPLLIFLHEGLGSIAQWKDFPERLCKEFKLSGLLYDRYGYGHSTELQEKRTTEYLEKEAEYFLSQLIEKLQFQNRKIILIGHSDGASISLIYAALFPKNIIKVISIAAHVFTEQISVDSINKIKKEYQRNSSFKKSLEKYHFNHTDSTFYAFAETITSNEFKSWNIEHFLPEIEAPVLVIQGDNDEYGTKKQVDSIYNKAANPNNKKLIIKECGHSPHLTNQQIVIEEIKNFIV